MKSNFKKEISVISEDILEIKIDLEKSAIKGSELYWHLAEHLLSNQNDIEVIAVNDGSNDNSRIILESLKRKNYNFLYKLVNIKKNKGIYLRPNWLFFVFDRKYYLGYTFV